jgi:hypothetical protein
MMIAPALLLGRCAAAGAMARYSRIIKLDSSRMREIPDQVCCPIDSRARRARRFLTGRNCRISFERALAAGLTTKNKNIGGNP